ncbi:general stress protein 26 [Nocardia tenerifensis]|uniref:General stress protein 26 n=1 Tax=Nocardia tenerifensis TaxID=228006 RepID=A0A318K7D7_9NOCA|nr:pyridoxamine 5'-phosphate oxidase family protein [Nocardia tenerifensis]PXX68584.1 general stress protein 26 [Nocardia tenerifensis]
MPELEPTGELNEDFSSPGATAPPWSAVREVLTTSEMFWLSTTRRDGRPHVTPLPAIWHDGSLHICTGDQEQKAANLAAEPRCVLTTGTNRMNSGLDVVVEGTAARVTDQATLRELSALWKSQLDWDFAVVEGGFNDGAGRVGLVYAVAPEKVLAFGKGEPFSQTRYRFG